MYIYGYMHVGMCTWMQELEEARKGNWTHQHFPGAWVARSLLVWVLETELRTSARAVCGLNHRAISPALMSIFTRKYLNRRCPELYTNQCIIPKITDEGFQRAWELTEIRTVMLLSKKVFSDPWRDNWKLPQNGLIPVHYTCITLWLPYEAFPITYEIQAQLTLRLQR